MKKLLMKITAAGTALCCAAMLCACGNGADTSAADTPSSQTSTVAGSNQLTEKYGNYIDSFTSEMDVFVNGDMDTVLMGISGLDASNFAEWNQLYQNAYETSEHLYNEVGAAEMLCPEDKRQAHQDLVQTVGTIYKIMEGLKDRAAAAESGDFSQLSGMADSYTEADKIAHEMWEKALSQLK